MTSSVPWTPAVEHAPGGTFGAAEWRADVAIVGAGPAGCAAAILLARDGVDVLMIDRATFPRDKVCGDGLAPRSVAALRHRQLVG
jgi:2-polyprenyl-6-methoxyphenol hydroxylase-like FAD-dependent oxidoreductase